MNLLSPTTERKQEKDYWLALDGKATDAGELAMLTLGAKLEGALQGLGKLDYSLKSSLDRLRCDLTTETHDHLHGHVVGLIEPEIQEAVANLANVIERAKYLIDELVADAPGSVAS